MRGKEHAVGPTGTPATASRPAASRDVAVASAAEWKDRARTTAEDIARVVPEGQRFLLVDNEQLRTELPDRSMSFPERDGSWLGPPADDVAAIRELDRRRRSGEAQFIVFTWPAFWWMDHYTKLYRMLQWGFPCVLRNDRLVVYDLRRARAGYALGRWLPHISDLGRLGSRLSSGAAGLQWWLRMSKLAWIDHASGARHLCELISSVQRSGLPSVTLATVLDRLKKASGASPERVHVHPLLRGGGSGAAAEIAALAAITAAKRPRRVLEFGTYDGGATWHMWANSDQSTHIVTLDLPPNTTVEGSTDIGFQGIVHRRFLPRDSRVRLVETDSRLWQPDVRGLDLCFIDAGHSYECVKNDTEKALPLMNPDGIVIWHDATWRRDGYGVNRYLHELRRQGFDVRQLVIGDFEFCCMAILMP